MTQVYAKHLRHVGLLLQQLETPSRPGARQPPDASPQFFLVKEQAELFWELIAFRVRGHGALLLGAMCFRRQDPKPDSYSRRSLISYLSSPPKELGLSRAARPARMVEIIVPEAGEDLAAFRHRLQSGDRGRNLFLDVETIDFAFDFRVRNPSVDLPLIRTAAPETHLLRTVRGHVLSGRIHDFHAKLHREESFFALIDPVQHTRSGRQPLPTLALHRSFVSMSATLPENSDPGEWLVSSVPFHFSTAEARHLLLPDAE